MPSVFSVGQSHKMFPDLKADNIRMQNQIILSKMSDIEKIFFRAHRSRQTDRQTESYKVPPTNLDSPS